MAMKASKRGLAEIASHEGIVNAPYRDSTGVFTVGIGHTASAGSPDPATKRGEYSLSEIMDIFARDIAKFERRVNRAFTRPLTQQQFDAALSFDFNSGGIHRATWVKLFNAGDERAAREAFMQWRKPPEIIPRRRKERDLFFDGRYSGNGTAVMYPATSDGRVIWGRGRRVNVMEILDGVSAPEPRQTEPKSPPSGKASFWSWLFDMIGKILRGGK